MTETTAIVCVLALGILGFFAGYGWAAFVEYRRWCGRMAGLGLSLIMLSEVLLLLAVAL